MEEPFPHVVASLAPHTVKVGLVAELELEKGVWPARVVAVCGPLLQVQPLPGWEGGALTQTSAHPHHRGDQEQGPRLSSPQQVGLAPLSQGVREDLSIVQV